MEPIRCPSTSRCSRPAKSFAGRSARARGAGPCRPGSEPAPQIRAGREVTRTGPRDCGPRRPALDAVVRNARHPEDGARTGRGDGWRDRDRRIGGLIAAVEPLTTPLVAQMDHFARWLSFMVLLCAGLLLVHGHFVGHHDFATRFMVVVGLVGGAWSMSRAPPSACCACAPGSTRRIGTSGPKRWRGAGCGCWRLRAGAGTGIVSIPRRWRGPPPFFNGQFGPPVKD